MPQIEDPNAVQSCVTGWQPKYARGNHEFPKFLPKHQTFDLFAWKYPTTAKYRRTLMPEQLYAGASRQCKVDNMKAALAGLPTERTLEFRWRVSKEKPAFSMDFLDMFLARKYGPIHVIYQQALNTCIVVFKNTESAYAVGRDRNPGAPHGRLYARQWNPSSQNNDVIRVLKHMEKSVETGARFNTLMDKADRLGFQRQLCGYSRVLSFRNTKFGPSMGAVLASEKGVDGVFSLVTPEPQQTKLPPIGKKSFIAEVKLPPQPVLHTPQTPPPLSEPSTQKSADLIRVASTHSAFTKELMSRAMAVVKFHASWCKPCKVIAPYIDQMARDYPEVTFISVDIDENEETADNCGISLLPTFQFYIFGQNVGELKGCTLTEIEENIRQMKGIYWALQNPGQESESPQADSL